MEHMNEEDERIEEEIEKFKEHLERKYGVTTEDVLKRLEHVENTRSGDYLPFGLTPRQNKTLIVILVIALGSALTGLGYILQLNNCLNMKISSASCKILNDQLFLSFRDISGSYSLMIENGGIDYLSIKQMLDGVTEIRIHSRLLRTLDSKNFKEWYILKVMSDDLYMFFWELNQEIYSTQGWDDPFVLTVEQIDLFIEMKDCIDNVMTVSDTHIDTTQQFKVDESILEQSIEAAAHISDLIDDGYHLFNLNQ